MLTKGQIPGRCGTQSNMVGLHVSLSRERLFSIGPQSYVGGSAKIQHEYSHRDFPLHLHASHDIDIQERAGRTNLFGTNDRPIQDEIECRIAVQFFNRMTIR